jgi:hypothetical protein
MKRKKSEDAHTINIVGGTLVSSKLRTRPQNKQIRTYYYLNFQI